MPPVAAVARCNHWRRIRAPLAVTTVLIATASCWAAPANATMCRHTNAQISRISTKTARTAVVCLINSVRATHDLPALQESSPLDVAAQRWTNVMIDTGVFAHSASFGQRVTDAGLRWQALGENIATGFFTPRWVVHAWMASKDHCQNILDPTYRAVGVGIDLKAVHGYATAPGTWTADFALPMGRSAPSHNLRPFDGCPY